MCISPVAAHDLDALQVIGIQSYKDHYSHIWTENGMNNFLNFHFCTANLKRCISDDTIRYFIAKEQQINLGFVKLKLNSPLPIDKSIKGLELEKIYFLKEAVGKGYGSEMMNFVLDYASENNHQCIWLDVLKSNTLAKSFYEKYSFKVVGEIPFITDISDIGMWVMLRK